MHKLLNEVSIPPRLRGDVLTEVTGIPRYWVMVWASMTGTSLAQSTQRKKLQYVEDLYLHAESMALGNLDDALASFNDKLIADVLESWFISLHNRAEVTGADELRWKTGLDFVISTITWLSKGQIPIERLGEIEKRVHRLSHLCRQLQVRKRSSSQNVRSLPAGVVESLYQIFDPNSDLNPFMGERTRWRAFVTFVMMLHQGLRRGELLLLTADAIKSGFDNQQNRTRYWLNIRQNKYDTENDDPRYSTPSIKTKHSIRQIPVNGAMAKFIQIYTENHRGRPDHAFLLNSQINKPLSTESLTKIFKKASSVLPQSALRELKDRTGKDAVTPHDLRHTCAVARLNQLLQQGDSMDEALAKLRTFFGWSKASDMPSRYARAVFEDRLSTVWNDIFDDRVTLLRAIPKGS